MLASFRYIKIPRSTPEYHLTYQLFVGYPTMLTNLFLDELIEVRPTHIMYYIDKANILVELNNIEEAVFTMDEAIAQHPKNADLLLHKGIYSLGYFQGVRNETQQSP